MMLSQSKPVEQSRRGVCCHCQSVHEVRVDFISWDEDSEWELDHNYVMKPHDFCGQTCDGSYTVPQTLVKD